jgi:hypothetical protein
MCCIICVYCVLSTGFCLCAYILPALHVTVRVAAWGHAVATKAGPNVMLNMRELAPLNILTNYFFRAVESKLCLEFQEKGEIKPFSHGKYTPIQEIMRLHDRAHRDRNPGPKTPDSPCADWWKDLLNKRGTVPLV